MNAPSLHIAVVQGPNLGRLGLRQPELYGDTTLSELTAALDRTAAFDEVRLTHFQSDIEGEIVQAVHREVDAGADGILINAAAYTHTSIAIADALVGVSYVEVHLTNVHAREPFRHRSLLAAGAIGVVAGFGTQSYELGLHGLVAHLRATKPTPR